MLAPTARRSLPSESDVRLGAWLTPTVRKCPQCGARYEDAMAFCPADGTRTDAEAADVGDPLIGTVVDGRYRIEQRIGEGGMGVVYRAAHVALNKPFALKVIRADQATDPNIVQRFLREARTASGIGHPNIVNINDFGTIEDGSAYLAMEFLDGVTLAQVMQAGPIPYPRALGMFIQIADALEAAHEQGIVHRDLKPENIMVLRAGTPNEVLKVLDFGIAKVKNAAAKLTQTGLVFGTPHYMAPEQAAGQPVDHRSDIYSLGVIMFQVLAGELPFAAESHMALMTKHMFEPAPSLRESGHAVPSALDAIVARCLQKKPELRHASMRELERDLRRVQLSPVSEPQPTAPLSALSMSASFGACAPPAPFTAASETLDEAELAGDAALDDEEEPLSVPKRRPVWLWAVVAGIFVMIALSFGARSRAPSAEPSPQAAEDLPRGTAAPESELPSGVAAPEASQPAAAPGAADSASGQAARSQPTAATSSGAAASTSGSSTRPQSTAPSAATPPASGSSTRTQSTAAAPSAATTSAPNQARPLPAAAAPSSTAKPSEPKRAADNKPAPAASEGILDPWR